MTNGLEHGVVVAEPRDAGKLCGGFQERLEAG
jgi:hypothetical protein